MNNISDYLYREMLMRSVTAFQAALKGPDPEGLDRDAPVLDDYLIVLQGQKMTLQGYVTGHPKLGSSFITTSQLIHVSRDGKWARTLTRHYRIEDAQQVDTSRLSPGDDLAGFCFPVGSNAFSIPLHLARRMIEQQPTALSRRAREKGLDDVAEALSEIAKSWPPRGDGDPIH